MGHYTSWSLWITFHLGSLILAKWFLLLLLSRHPCSHCRLKSLQVTLHLLIFLPKWSIHPLCRVLSTVPSINVSHIPACRKRKLNQRRPNIVHCSCEDTRFVQSALHHWVQSCQLVNSYPFIWWNLCYDLRLRWWTSRVHYLYTRVVALWDIAIS